MRIIQALILCFFFAAAAAPIRAQTAFDSLKSLEISMQEATSHGSIESAKNLSSEAIDGTPHQQSASVDGAPFAATGTETTENTTRAVSKRDLPDIPRPPHVPPRTDQRRPGALRLLFGTAYSILTVPAATALAGYHLASNKSNAEHKHITGYALGTMGMLAGLVVGVILIPFAMAISLGKAVKAMCEGRW